MVIKNKKANKVSKAETKNYTEDPKKKEMENNQEMMFLIYVASLLGQM